MKKEHDIKKLHSGENPYSDVLKGQSSEVRPEPDEIEAIAEAKADMSPTVPHESINWE